jgi:antitoxin component of MazEF toxin-antitoxin module
VKRQKLKLTDLLAKCDANAALPQAVSEWDNAAAMGNEIW